MTGWPNPGVIMFPGDPLQCFVTCVLKNICINLYGGMLTSVEQFVLIVGLFSWHRVFYGKIDKKKLDFNWISLSTYDDYHKRFIFERTRVAV